MRDKKLKISTALLLIMCSVVFISGPCYLGVYFYLKNQKEKLVDPQYNIVTIVQFGPKEKALETTYLAELMDLSADRPTNLFAFDVNEAEKKLLKSPLIKEVHVKKEKPGAVYVDYLVREPSCRVLDYEDRGIDDEGYLFPIDKDKVLPEVILGQIDNNEKRIQLALSLFSKLQELKDNFRILKIDVSKAFEQSYGKREIVLQLESELILPYKEKHIHFIFPKLIRLTTKSFDEQIGNLLALLNKMIVDYKKQLEIDDTTPEIVKFTPRVIDLRVEKLAFVDKT